MAIVGAAVTRGWQLAEIRAASCQRSMKGLAALYERRSEPGRTERLLPLEWRKCIDGMDDPADYNEMCRWPVILADGVRAPPALTRAVEIA